MNTCAAAPNSCSSTRRAHDVGDVGADGLGDRGDVDGEPGGAAPTRERVVDRGGVRREVQRHRHGRHAVGEQLDQPTDDAAVEAGVGHLVVAHRVGTLDGDARRCRAAPRRAASAGARRPASVGIGHVTMRTSSKPRVSATSARLRASPECPQITGSARTTITRRFVAVMGGSSRARLAPVVVEVCGCRTPSGGRTVVAQRDGSGPSSMCSRPPRCSSASVSQLRSSATPSRWTDWTYWTGPSGLGFDESRRLDHERAARHT